MKPASHKLFVSLSSQPTKPWQLHWMAMARRGMKPVRNQYETGFETGMKPIYNHCITQTSCFFLVTAYKAMAAVLDSNRKTRYETGMKPGMKPVWKQYKTTA